MELELKLRQAGGRVASSVLPILRQYSSSSSVARRNLASRSRPSNCSAMCLRPAGLEKESSSSTTTTTTRSTTTVCVRRGSFEVQQGCKCISGGGDVELLIGGQRWDDAPTGQQFGIGDMNFFGPQQRRCRLSQSDMKFLLISALQPQLDLRYKTGRWRRTQNRTCFA